MSTASGLPSDETKEATISIVRATPDGGGVAASSHPIIPYSRSRTAALKRHTAATACWPCSLATIQPLSAQAEYTRSSAEN